MPHYANEKSSSREITIESKTLMDDAHETITAEFRIAQKELAERLQKVRLVASAVYVFVVIAYAALMVCCARRGQRFDFQCVG